MPRMLSKVSALYGLDRKTPYGLFHQPFNCPWGLYECRQLALAAYLSYVVFCEVQHPLVSLATSMALLDGTKVGLTIITRPLICPQLGMISLL